MGKLEGKVAVITGGGRGQGRAHAVTFAREGADVVVCDIAEQIEPVPYAMNSAGDLAATKRLVEAEGRRCLALNADVRDSAQVQSVVDAAVDELGGVDVLVANAGVWSPATVSQMSDGQWREAIAVNLTGVFYSIRAASRAMISRGSGRIIATSSNLGRQGMQNMSNYVATKWGVIGLVKSAAIELGPYNITVNAVCPTMVATEMTQNDVLYRMFRPDLDEPTRADTDELILTRLHKLPVAWLEPEEISRAMLFLASDDARHITGTALDVTAGQSTQYAA